MALAEVPISISTQRWKIEMVRVADLRIDPTYHAPARYNAGRAKNMADNLDIEALGVIHVSRRSDGSLIIIDGNHRVSACRMAGEEYITAKVFYGLTRQEEALLYRKLSDAVRLTSYALWLSALEGKDPEAIAIYEILAARDIYIVGGAKAAQYPGRTRAVAMINKIYKADLLDQTLTVAQKAWPEDLRALDAIPLAGIASFIWGYKTHPQFSMKRLSVKLAQESASALIRKAKDFSNLGSSYGLSLSTGGAREKDSRWNTGRAAAGGGGSNIGSFKAPRQAVLLRYNDHLTHKLDDLTSSQIHRLAVMRQDIWLGLMEDK
jgi:hypothetical protein